MTSYGEGLGFISDLGDQEIHVFERRDVRKESPVVFICNSVNDPSSVVLFRVAFYRRQELHTFVDHFSKVQAGDYRLVLWGKCESLVYKQIEVGTFRQRPLFFCGWRDVLNANFLPSGGKIPH